MARGFWPRWPAFAKSRSLGDQIPTMPGLACHIHATVRHRSGRPRAVPSGRVFHADGQAATRHRALRNAEISFTERRRSQTDRAVGYTTAQGFEVLGMSTVRVRKNAGFASLRAGRATSPATVSPVPAVRGRSVRRGGSNPGRSGRRLTARSGTPEQLCRPGHRSRCARGVVAVLPWSDEDLSGCSPLNERP
jgi:hypothetical protein